MCGRYVSVRSKDELLDEFEAVDVTDGAMPEPSFNVAPTDPVAIVLSRPLRDEHGNRAAVATRQLRTAMWGLIPSWSQDRKGAARMINARVESVSTKPAFRTALARRRCLVPADGWYEWQILDTATGPRKQPLYMHPTDAHALAFAGLYEFWRDPQQPKAPTLTTCTVITSPSAGALESVHERMPLVLPRSSWSRWLAPSVADPSDMLAPWDEAAGEHLELRPVSTLVNKVENNSPGLVAPADPEREDATLS